MQVYLCKCIFTGASTLFVSHLSIRQYSGVVAVNKLAHKRPDGVIHGSMVRVLGYDLVVAEALTAQLSLDLVRLRVHCQRMAAALRHLSGIQTA